MGIEEINSNEYILKNAGSKLNFWLLEDETMAIYDFKVIEKKEDAFNLIKSLEHFAFKNAVQRIDIASTPNRKSLEFWQFYGYQYSNFEEDRKFIDVILQTENPKEVFDTDSGVIMLHKTFKELSEETYINKVFNNDILETLKKIPDNSLDMVYGDPDYNVGINYAGKNYTQKWNDYIDWYVELTQESLRVLKPTGSLFMINYPKQNAYLRVKYLDENAFDVQDYVWVYNTNVGHSPRRFTTAHRSVLHATKSKKNHFYKDNVAVPYQNPTDKRIKERIANGHKGRMPYSWFYFDLVKNVSKDKTFHACQIPLGLVEMLIKSCTMPQDDVMILFGGSGSEIVLCKDLERNFISSELHEEYYTMILDRLENNGQISEKYRLEFLQEKKDKMEDEKVIETPNLFSFQD